ncbi:MAG: FAD-binding and (Fe-S)-binding domain-containing protein [Desulfuromonadaceae bacterium]|nr:FAD-binding and (Fe-S)-binding domain-containing protein [Desulfuromonadaceae bacterium]
MISRNKPADIARLPEKYRNFYHECVMFIPESRVFCDPISTLAYGTDASVYRLTPKIVIKVSCADEMARIIRLAYSDRIAVTFRAAGTSLSGQAVTDSVLLVMSGSWVKCVVADNGETISLEPGIIGAEANAYLKPYNRKIGPDPASINHAMIGGIAANNASGMCCGTTDNSYKTVTEMKIIFHDGTLLDTSNPASRTAFLASHRNLVSVVENIRDEIAEDSNLSELIKRKYKIKNTTGYGINSFVDHQDPVDIIKHLMIGSEGTLGFIADITFRTIVEHAHKASALIFFPDIANACQGVMQLDRTVVSAAELMDRIALRSVDEKPGMPEYLKTLNENVTALLVEVRGENLLELEEKVGQLKQRLAGLPTVFPITFTDVKSEYEALWNIRKGLFPAVGNVRRIGTSVIIEDIAFPLERLAEATVELRSIMIRNGFGDAIIFGHALDGNLHFVLTPDFTRQDEVDQYEKFMQEVCSMVVEGYGGALKAEHGTGRNMAPFVEMEWGVQAYTLMKRIKQAFDPYNLINPGVLINDNPDVYLENLKHMPQAHEKIDKCIECGFCEIMCPSKHLTSTPRQRITARRQIAGLRHSGADPGQLQRLEQDYAYWGEATCAADGLCATTCPVSINTGDYTKLLRNQKHSAQANAAANYISRHFAGTAALMRTGLSLADLLHQMLGTSVMLRMTGTVRDLSHQRLPLWSPWMPQRGSVPRFSRLHQLSKKPKVVYFPSCSSRMMGPAQSDPDQRPLSTAVSAVLNKAGYEIILLEDMDKLCCGMAFDSKGFFEAAEAKIRELETALMAASNSGEYPVLCDTSPCLFRMRQTLDKRLKLYEPVEFIHDFLMQRLIFTKASETVAIHVTCSSTKMLLAEKFKTVACACAEKIVTPTKVTCCGFAGSKGFDTPELTASALATLNQALPADCKSGYSNSRPCEIGLSQHSGINYQSIVYLVDRCTTGRDMNISEKVLPESRNRV